MPGDQVASHSPQPLPQAQLIISNFSGMGSLHVSSSAIAMSFSQIFGLFTMSQLLSRKCKIILMPSTHQSVWLEEEITMTVVALLGILLKRL